MSKPCEDSSLLCAAHSSMLVLSPCQQMADCGSHSHMRAGVSSFPDPTGSLGSFFKAGEAKAKKCPMVGSADIPWSSRRGLI